MIVLYVLSWNKKAHELYRSLGFNLQRIDDDEYLLLPLKKQVNLKKCPLSTT